MSLMDDLKKELGNRIERDMTPFGKWNAVLWAKIAFGDYYGKAPAMLPVIHRVVGETVDNVLARDGWQMTIDSWNGLKNAIDATDTAETALPDMEEAALVVEPRAVNDGHSLAVAAAFELEAEQPTKKVKGRKKYKEKTKKGQ